jgi:hypothetical protein
MIIYTHKYRYLRNHKNGNGIDGIGNVILNKIIKLAYMWFKRVIKVQKCVTLKNERELSDQTLDGIYNTLCLFRAPHTKK